MNSTQLIPTWKQIGSDLISELEKEFPTKIFKLDLSNSALNIVSCADKANPKIFAKWLQFKSDTNTIIFYNPIRNKKDQFIARVVADRISIKYNLFRSGSWIGFLFSSSSLSSFNEISKGNPISFLADTSLSIIRTLDSIDEFYYSFLASGKNLHCSFQNSNFILSYTFKPTEMVFKFFKDKKRSSVLFEFTIPFSQKHTLKEILIEKFTEFRFLSLFDSTRKSFLEESIETKIVKHLGGDHLFFKAILSFLQIETNLSLEELNNQFLTSLNDSNTRDVIFFHNHLLASKNMHSTKQQFLSFNKKTKQTRTGTGYARKEEFEEFVVLVTF